MPKDVCGLVLVWKEEFDHQFDGVERTWGVPPRVGRFLHHHRWAQRVAFVENKAIRQDAAKYGGGIQLGLALAWHWKLVPPGIDWAARQIDMEPKLVEVAAEKALVDADIHALSWLGRAFANLGEIIVLDEKHMKREL